MALILILAAVAVVGAVCIGGFLTGVFRVEKSAVAPDDDDPEVPAEAEAEESGEKYADSTGMEGFEDPDDFDLFGTGKRDFGDDLFSMDDPDGFGSPAQSDAEGEAEEPDQYPYDYFADPEPEPEPVAAAQDAPTPEPEPPEPEESYPLEFDRLCGFMTGRSFVRDCQRFLNHCRQDGTLCAVAAFDIDRFRFLNSLKGVMVGDFLLSRLSQDIANIFPDDSRFTRLSADHFVVLFPLVHDSVLADYIEQLRRLVDRAREDIGVRGSLRLSVGIALTVDSSRDYDMNLLMYQANIARHCGKISKEPYSLFDPSMTSTFLYGESAMESYSENQYDVDDHLIFYQPIYSLNKSRIIGCDTLVRWGYDDDNNKEVPLTPDNCKIPSNNLKILYQSCRWVGKWRQSGRDILLGIVSIPPTDFFKEDIDSYIIKCLSTFQLDEHAFGLSVSIHTLRIDPEIASRQIQRLRKIGIKIVVHDIDRSFPSLSLLSGLSIQYVKFHSSTSMGITESQERFQEVQSLIQSAVGIGAQTIFEGVDTQAQGDALRRAGAHMVEGLFAGGVEQPEEFLRYLMGPVSEPLNSGSTVILGDEALLKGNYRVY